MPRLGRHIRSCLARQEGAYLIEFLGGLTATLFVMLMVTQLLLVLITSTLVNNALQAAGQEASVQGGVNRQVREVFNRSLPEGLRPDISNPRDPDRPVLTRAPFVLPGLPSSPNTVDDPNRRGRELTKFGEPILLKASYDMPAPYFSPFGMNSLEMRRYTLVSSQSAKED